MDMQKEKNTIKVLNEEDLRIQHSTDVYQSYLHENILSSATKIENALDEFYKWVRVHKGQLNRMYTDIGYAENMIGSSHFIEWARQRFYIWKTNMHIKVVRSEIDSLTK